MNVLLQMISLLGRYLYILVAVAILGAMPMSGKLAWDALQEFQTAKGRLAVAREVRASQEQQLEKVKEYKKFSEEVQTFMKAAREGRLEESNWTTYDVDIKHRLSSVTELRTLLNNAGPTSRYYFRPEKLEITSLFAKGALPADLAKVLETKDGKGPGGLAKFLGREEKPPTPGDKVLVSLSGTYLVFPR
ncbi:MAG: hypothetical protein H7839_23620 [Magnetococcus sp. YQC-5]